MTARLAAIPLLWAALAAAAHADAEPARARASALGLSLELRSDFGFGRFVEVEVLSSERRLAMDLNDGLGISAGASFLPLAGGRLGTRLTFGVKAARLRVSNGAALFLAFPLDLTETAYVGPLRLGAGISLLVAPRVSGDGIFEHSRVRFAPAPGAVADAEWMVSPGTRTGIGLRASWHRFSANGTARGAAALGLLVRADFDLVRGR
jgi:hypothetical protein